MFTVCPKCALTLVVTVADLRVGQGYVRCGRCSNVFNALLTLSEEREEPASPYPNAAATQSRPALVLTNETDDTDETDETPALQDAALELDSSDDEGVIPETALEFDPTSADLAQVFIEPTEASKDDATGVFETIVLRGDEAPEEHDVEADEIDAELRAIVSQLGEPPSAELKATDGGSVQADVENADVAADEAQAETPASTAAADSVPENAAPVDPELLFDGQGGPARSRLARAAWAGGLALLVLTLAAQIVHHYRHEIAAMSPSSNRALTTAYGKFGVTLVPRWNLHAYEVRQLGAAASVENAGQLTVRASVMNAAQRPQPVPYLRVMLQDRFGNSVAAGDVPPQAYLPNGAREPLLSAGQRIDAEVAFADPGQDAVGFEIDVCLPAPDGGIVCANDLKSR